jgi:hypothetical protein
MKKGLVQTALLNSLGVAVYTGLVAFLMYNGDKLFGDMDNVIGPMAFLLLFVFSALIVGVLVLGKPIMLYLDGSKKEAVQTLGFTILFIFVLMILAISGAAIF